MSRINKRSTGFSLIELMAVLAILGILAAAAMPMSQLVAKRSKEQELRYDLRLFLLVTTSSPLSVKGWNDAG